MCMSNEELVSEIQKELIGIWGASEDWGEDEFTITMGLCSSSEARELINKNLNTSMLYAAELLVYEGPYPHLK